MKVVLGFLVTILLTTQSYAQGEIPVSMYTGTPGIFIPLYAISDHDLAENISLTYNLSDLRLGGAHRYGVGWDISVGGQVSRKVRGLPDDFAGAAGDSRRGWLYNNNYSAILSFPNSSDTLSSTSVDEVNDQSFIQNLVYLQDTEPDLFTFSVGGQSGNFVFGNDGTVQLIPYQDIIIVPTYRNQPTDMTIVKWTITTNDGVVYTLDERCSASYKLSKSTNDADGVNETLVNAFGRDFQYYQTAAKYYSSWMLSKTKSPTGATLTYSFTIKASAAPKSDKRAMIFDAQWQINPQNIVKLNDFTLMTENGDSIKTDTIKFVSGIRTSTGVRVSLDPIDGVKVYDSLRSFTNTFKEFVFTYTNGFLTTVTETDHARCTQMPPYRMYYTNTSDYPQPGGFSMQSQDFWGYYNGASNSSDNAPPPPGGGGGIRPTDIPTIYLYPNEPAAERYRLYPIPAYSGFSLTLTGNANRRPDPNNITHGTLSRLVYPTGGESDFTFEANKYWDARAGRDQLGGGIRIKSIVYYNGIDPTPNITKNFTYLDASGHSSGRLITRPSFAIPVWKYSVPSKGTNTGFVKLFSDLPTPTLQWRDLTLLTGWDLSDQEYTAGSPVGYSKVTVSRPGSGKVVFEYSLPATYNDTGAGTGNTRWNPTTTKFARGSSLTMGIISVGEPRLYATFPNKPYDYERGLLLVKSEFNETGTLVRRTANTYQYLFKGTQPVTVVGLAYDLYAGSPGIFLYGKYTSLANVAKVLSKETVTTYDENNTAKHASQITQYTYGSTFHRYATKITRTTPDGTVYGTIMKYAQDYPVTTPGDTPMSMIQKLQQANRNSVVIEQQSNVKFPGGTEKTTSASLMIFGPFQVNRPLLRYTMAFRPQAPVTDFVPSGVSGTNTFTSDSRYETIGTINEYTAPYDMPVSANGEDRVVNATLYGFKNRLSVARVNRALAANVGFSDFETSNTASFTVAGLFVGTGRTGANATHPSATLTRRITKPSTASRYLLTFWLKNTPGVGVTLNVTLKDTLGAIKFTSPFTYTPSGSAYQYFVQSIDVSTIPTRFDIQIAGSGTPSLLPMLDDVAFFPDYASISSTTYDVPFGMNSATAANGMTSFTSYDGLGRTKLIRDQDNNIRKRFTYNMPGQTSPILVAAIASHSGNFYVSGSDVLTAQDNTCINGELYEWDFGDGAGFTTPSSSPVSPSHSYVSIGSRTITLRVSHPDYVQPVTFALPITVVRPPLTASTCAGGVMTMDSGGSTIARYNCITPAIPDGYIKVVATAGNVLGSALTYQWMKRDTGTGTWTTTAETTNTYPQTKVEKTMNSFDLMCVVSADDGRTVNSDIVTITINH
jgi:hypothetical protein